MIQIFVTGGTFDKEYDMRSGTLYFNETHLPEMLARGRFTLDYKIRTLMMIDSLDMGTAERELIAYNCIHCESERILITHGTDRMVETATYLSSRSELAHKTIVLTGALVPYAFGSSSDGFFNLGSALAFVQTKAAGIYVAMNGICFAWNEVAKNTITGNFERNVPVAQ